MSLDHGILGVVDGPHERAWTVDDTAVYAHAIGGPAATFAIALAQYGGPQLGLPGADMTQVLHAEQSLVLHRPLPAQGSVQVTRRVTEILDKGSGALVVSTWDAAPWFSTRSSCFIKGEGGFGGPRGESARFELPDRAPDAVLRFQTSGDQALRYRETGDVNPMHWDPEFAARGGFARPILHGLATYGITFRLLAGEFGELSTMDGRFTSPVHPGDELTVRAWRTERGIVFSTGTDQQVLAGVAGQVGQHLRAHA